MLLLPARVAFRPVDAAWLAALATAGEEDHIAASALYVMYKYKFLGLKAWD